MYNDLIKIFYEANSHSQQRREFKITIKTNFVFIKIYSLMVYVKLVET